MLVAPPRFAPELTNLVTLYDTVYDMAVRNLGIRPDIFTDGLWQRDHLPDWDGDIKPILERAHHYRWVVAIPTHPHDPDFDKLGDPSPASRASARPGLLLGMGNGGPGPARRLHHSAAQRLAHRTGPIRRLPARCGTNRGRAGTRRGTRFRRTPGPLRLSATPT